MQGTGGLGIPMSILFLARPSSYWYLVPFTTTYPACGQELLVP